MTPEDHTELFVKGSIIGHLIGDALGYPWSGTSQIPSVLQMIDGPSGELPGEYTCHGAFTIATIASINECDKIDSEDIIEKLYEVYIGGYMTSDGNCYDVGESTAQAINNYANGIPLDRCGLEINDSDALARMLPIALYTCKMQIPSIIDNAHRICSLTHKHPRSHVVCAAYCLIIRNLLLQKAEKVFDVLLHHYKQNELHFKATQELQGMSQNYKNSDVEECFWTTWSYFSKYENDYQFAVTEAIRNGSDKNAVGAVTGSLSAIMNGLNDIPVDWLRTIRLTSEVMETIMHFTNIIIRGT